MFPTMIRRTVVSSRIAASLRMKSTNARLLWRKICLQLFTSGFTCKTTPSQLTITTSSLLSLTKSLKTKLTNVVMTGLKLIGSTSRLSLKLGNWFPKKLPKQFNPFLKPVKQRVLQISLVSTTVAPKSESNKNKLRMVLQTRCLSTKNPRCLKPSKMKAFHKIPLVWSKASKSSKKDWKWKILRAFRRNNSEERSKHTKRLHQRWDPTSRPSKRV